MGQDKKRSILILSADTDHHRYFINRILSEKMPIEGCLFETTHVEPKDKVQPFFEEQQKDFESEEFFKEIPCELKIPVYQTRNINAQEAAQLITKVRPTLGISFGTRKIEDRIIKLFPDGIINVHRGIADRFRGLDSELWAIFFDEFENIGVTIHQVNSQLDTGDIVCQSRLELRKDMKIHQLRYYLTILATDLVLQALKDYQKGRLSFYPQSNRGEYFSFIPHEKKEIAAQKFNSYCLKLDKGSFRT